MFTVKDADIKDDNGRIPLSEKSNLLNIVTYSSRQMIYIVSVLKHNIALNPTS